VTFDKKRKSSKRAPKSRPPNRLSSARADLPQNRGNRPYKRRDKDYRNPWGEPMIKNGVYYVRPPKGKRRKDRDDDD